MWIGRGSHSNSWVSDSSVGTSWTLNGSGHDTGNDIETIREESTIGTGSDDEDRHTVNETMSSFSAEKKEDVEQILPPLSYQKLDGSWACLPYKVEKLERELFNHTPGSDRRTAIIEALRQIGVKVFVIDSESTENTEELLKHVRRVVGYVARENCIAPRSGPLGFQRCLLYQDEQGRLFNLILSQHTIGPASTWLEYLDSFSGCQAMMALTVLCRSFPCIANVSEVQNFRPAYLSLILGLALTEEISLSWLNASMMIRATPSVSAHSLISSPGSDTLRKGVLFMLAVAGATQGLLQTLLIAGGIIGACLILLANLGARTWHFLRWKPVKYNGPGSFALAFTLAVATGFLLPYMGHRSITVGGKGAMEYVLTTAMIVAGVFVVTDFDDLQRYLVVGSEEACDQDPVNLFVGAWWTITLLVSLFFVRRIPYLDQKPAHGERLLAEDQASPVGYKVPSIPDFEIDPSLANTGSKCLSLDCELLIGLVMAVGVGTWLVSLAFTLWEDRLYDNISDSV